MAAKYDTIGINYNQTRKADPYLAQQLRHHLAPRPDGRYLDIGCGTGNYTMMIQDGVYDFVGVDPSEEMLQQARRRSSDIDWRQGRAEQCGLPDASVDGIVASLTIHHWHNLAAGCREMWRVLRPGGRMVIFTSTPVQMRGYWLNHYFPKMLADSIQQMPARAVLERCLSEAGFDTISSTPYSIHPELIDLFLYCGKHQPERYLDARIRAGISSFADLANQAEVTQGLSRLQSDIGSGAITQIMANYANTDGDYLYLVASKPA